MANITSSKKSTANRPTTQAGRSHSATSPSSTPSRLIQPGTEIPSCAANSQKGRFGNSTKQSPNLASPVLQPWVGPPCLRATAMGYSRTMRFFAAALVLAAAALAQSPAATPYRYLRAGAAANLHASTRGGFALIGGGTDLDQAFQWMCDRSGHGDFLVLRASGTDAYNPYIQKLCPQENSVATLILPSRAAALDPLAANTIRAASAIFIAGGDQSNYVNFWAATPVQKELNAAIRRGVPLGGTSAGLAVLGEWGYSAQHDRPDGPDLTSAV